MALFDTDDQEASPAPFRLAAVQMDVAFGAVAENLERLQGKAREAVGSGAQLVVFPECALTGYCFESRDEAEEVAETRNGPAALEVEALCRELGAYVVYGYIERDGAALYNALSFCGPAGRIAGYRKIHMPNLGLDRYAAPGDAPFAVHETPLGRVGMNICYDGSFPESGRLLALAGADLITLPTNWPTGAEEFARYGINTRGLENMVYYAAVNRVGVERGFRFIGGSRIVDVHGRTLAEADESSETILYATVDPRAARTKRIVRVPGKHSIDRFADRRPEFYDPGLFTRPPRETPQV